MLPSPDPSCSGLKHDTKPPSYKEDESDLLNTCPLDVDNQFVYPTFSIRDHVQTARKESIGTNWPFSQQSLHFFLKHGVNNVLPPFEPPDSVKKLCLTNGLGSHIPVSELNNKYTTQEVACCEEENVGGDTTQEELTLLPVHTSLLESERTIGSDEQIRSAPINHVPLEFESVPKSSFLCSVQHAGTSNLWKDSIEVDDLEAPCLSETDEATFEPLGKKCRVVIKSVALSDSTWTEEDGMLNTAVVSDSMASKVCPVCKNFSSTSNTTLNAHIDQCLSVESTSKWAMDANKMTKHRVKLRKKRSMVDIYKTAQYCTLEELDRRNGTNWATDSSLPNAESGVCAQGKRQRMSQVDVDDNGDENAVYFDSNGTKIMILSKFADASASTAGEDSRPRKIFKNNKEGKIPSSEKKQSFGPKHPKKFKSKSGKKKLYTLDASKIHDIPEMEHEIKKSCVNEESQTHQQKDRDDINRSELGTLRQWVCSKRTRMLKKATGKDSGRRLRGSPSSITSNQLESNKVTSGNSPKEGSPLLKTAEPSRTISSSPSGGSLLKLPRSPGTFVSSPRSKRIEVHSSATMKPDSSAKIMKPRNPLESCTKISMKGKKRSISSRGVSVRSSLSSIKSKESGRRQPLGKSCMHATIADLAKQVGALPLNVEGRNVWNQTQKTDKFDGSSDTVHTEREETRDGVLKPRKRRETSGNLGREEAAVLKLNLVGPEFCGLDQTPTAGSHLEVPIQHLKLFPKKVNEIEMGREEVLFHENTATGTVSRKDSGGSTLKSSQFAGSHLAIPIQHSNTSTNKVNGIEMRLLEAISHEDAVTDTASRKDIQGPILKSSQSAGSHLRIPVQHSFTEEHGRQVFGSLVEKSMWDELKKRERNQVKNTISRNHFMAPEVNTRVGDGISYSYNQYRRCGTDPAPFLVPRTSFLASLGDTGSDDLHSSVTSNKIMPSQDRHLMADRDSSGSPVSGASIISNPTTARPDSMSSEPVSSAEPPEALVKFSSDPLPFMLSAKGVERTDSYGEGLRASTATRDGSTRFTTDQPCCCSRKDNFSLGSPLGYQDSPLLDQRAASSSSVIPGKGKQMMYKNNRSNMFVSPNSGPVSRIGDATVPVFPLSSGPFSRKASCDAARKLTNCSDSLPARPSAQVVDAQVSPKPVLRLMGKDLTVENKDEEVAVQVRQLSQVSPSKSQSTAAYTNFGYPNNYSSQDQLPFSHVARENYAVFSNHSLYSLQPPYFDVDHSKGFRALSNSKPQHMHPKELVGNQCNASMGGLIDSSLQQHGFKGRVEWQTPQKTPMNRPDSAFAYSIEKDGPKEVIVIDDSPENGAEPGMTKSNYAERFKGGQPSPVGVLPTSAGCLNLRQMNAYSYHGSSNPFSRRETPGVPKLSYLPPNPLKWAVSSEGSSVPLQRPFLPTPSTCHVNQAMYHSPNLR